MAFLKARFFFEPLEEKLTPALFNVTTPADAGPGSLRAAILSANANLGPDTIAFDPTVFQSPTTICLTSGQLDVTDDLNLIGTGAALLTIQNSAAAGPNSRVFRIDNPSRTINVSISDLTVTGGNLTGATNFGGGIQTNDELLSLLRVSVVNNHSVGRGAGISQNGPGTLTLTACTVMGNATAKNAGGLGGGIANESTGAVIIQSSTITGNSADAGGGAYFFNGGTFSIQASTVYNNTANVGRGGGIAFFGPAAGGMLKVVNSTIANNAAATEGGGIALRNFTGLLQLQNSTVTNNLAGLQGGGLSISGNYLGTAQLFSTILSGNLAPTAADIAAVQPVHMSFSAVGQAKGFGSIDDGNNLPFGADLHLLPLATNGGMTATCAFQPGSAAIDEGASLPGTTVDQCGHPRINGPAADIGAYESVTDDRPIATLSVPPTLTSDGGTSSSFTVTYDDATAIKADTIDGLDIQVTGPHAFNASAKLVTIDQPTNGRPRIATYQFEAPGGFWDFGDNGAYAIVLKANQVSDTDGQWIVPSTLGYFRVLISNTWVVDSVADENDGVYSPGHLSLREAIALANANGAAGDAIQFDPTSFSGPKTIRLTLGDIAITAPLTMTAPSSGLTLDASGNKGRRAFTVDDHVPGYSIAVNISHVSFVNAMTTGTTTIDRGGAVSVADEIVNFTDCTFVKNQVIAGGGAAAITAPGGNINFLRCVFDRNQTTGSSSNGGAVRVGTNTNATFQQCTLSGNIAANDGGAIYVNGGSLSAVDCTFSGNSATGFHGGGAIALAGALAGLGATIRNCTITGNTASASGGAIAVTGAGNVAIQNCTVTANVAAMGQGGGISRAAGNASIAIDSSVIAGNQANVAADVYADFASISVNDSAIGSAAGFVTDGSGNLPFGIDLKLGPLLWNGGTTATLLPAFDSPLINAGSNPANAATDERGFSRTVGSRPDIGAVEIVDPLPTAVAAAPNVQSIASVYTFTVTYESASAINVATLGTGDVTVTGPNGFSILATFVSVDGNIDGWPRVATYQFTPSGGQWTGAASGSYTISMNAGQVADNSGTAVPPGPFGSFQVQLGRALVVTNTNDAGPGSLRQAILDANAVVSSDTITFDPSVFSTPQTILLDTGELAVTDSVNIVGTGPNNLAINAEFKSRIFDIVGGDPGMPIAISGLELNSATATGSGGAIFDQNAALSLQNVTIESCAAIGGSGGGIDIAGPGASLTMADCRVIGCTATGYGLTGNGGGISISVPTTAALSRTTVTGNTAYNNGGGIYAGSGASLAVIDSTISGNQSKYNSGGGIDLFGTVGPTGDLIRNSTISGNSAAVQGGGVAIVSAIGTVVIQNSTIATNTVPTNGPTSAGGGIALIGGGEALLAFESTLVAQNTNAVAPDLFRSPPDSILANHSLVGVANEGNFSLVGSGNLTGSSQVPLNPLIGYLANNGGPTLTHALLPGSPALNAGSNPAGLSFDQRGSGFSRLSGTAVDIGAYESLSAPPPPKVMNFRVNDGSAQRSTITSIQVTFSEAVQFPAGLQSAFQITYDGGPAPIGIVALTFAQSGSFVTISFNDPVYARAGHSLVDGNYSLRLSAAWIQGKGGCLDGNADGAAGDDPEPFAFFRLFGDADGNKIVNAADLLALRFSLGTTSATFDFDGNGVVDASDVLEFRSRFGASLP